jgi:hypothetical protein
VLAAGSFAVEAVDVRALPRLRQTQAP